VLSGRLGLAERTGDEEHFSQCREAVDRMHALIDGLLAVARAGAVVTDTEPVSIDDTVRSCWQTVPTVDATLRAETDRTVGADREQFRRLVENLLANAVEHGGETVTVTVGALPGGFYVADDGPGIPPEERDAVLERGYSLAPGGSGLGLAIVREAASAHGWDLTVCESDDGGARFEFTGVSEA
jgi:signal transduction histidine kinase